MSKILDIPFEQRDLIILISNYFEFFNWSSIHKVTVS